MEDTISGSTETRHDFTVLSLNRRAGELLSTAFPAPVWVRGEISQVSRTNPRGHVYFSLCEPSPDGAGQPLAVIDCALFAGTRPDVVREFAREGQAFQLREGMSVRVRGSVTIWDRGGRYQLVVHRIDPSWSMGDQAVRLRRLVDGLRREGVLEANGQLKMPSAPLSIGLITSRESAAYHDFIQGLRSSGYPFRVYAAWSSMQGERTATEVISAFNRLLGVPGLEVAVLTRGGGSATDLSWFNDERIARVISQVPWPVISGIGHETDTTLPDFASHTSLRTPTDCADFLVNGAADFLHTVNSLAAVLHRSAMSRTARARERLASLAAMLSRSGGIVIRIREHGLRALRSALHRNVSKLLRTSASRLLEHERALKRVLETGRLAREERGLRTLGRSLGSSARRQISMHAMLLDKLDAAIRANSPARLYRRGWATVRDEGGGLVRSIRDIHTEQDIVVTLRDGRVTARTDEIIPDREPI